MNAPMLQAAADRFGHLVRVRKAGDFMLRLTRYDPVLQLSPHRHPAAYFCWVVKGGMDERCKGSHRRNRCRSTRMYLSHPGHPK